MDGERRAELRRLREKATQGEWIAFANRLYVGDSYEGRRSLMRAPGGPCWIDRDEDIAIICSAVNALVPLLDALDAAERERDEWRRKYVGLRRSVDEGLNSGDGVYRP